MKRRLIADVCPTCHRHVWGRVSRGPAVIVLPVLCRRCEAMAAARRVSN